MKKLITLLATCALVFVAAGCREEKCEDAKNKGKTYCEEKTNFKDDKQCEWTPEAGAAADSKKGTCADKPTKTAREQAEEVCNTVQADTGTECAAKSTDAEAKDSTAKCVWSGTKCEAKDK